MGKNPVKLPKKVTEFIPDKVNLNEAQSAE